MNPISPGNGRPAPTSRTSSTGIAWADAPSDASFERIGGKVVSMSDDESYKEDEEVIG
jgi:hypothetical protein